METIDSAKLEMYGQELAKSINKLVDFTSLLESVKQSLDFLARSQENRYLLQIKKMESEMGYLRQQLERIGLPKIDIYERQLEEIKDKLSEKDWPAAFNEDLVCHNDTDEIRKAEAILDLVVTEYLKNLTFLDFGCGRGHVVASASKRGTKKAIGYDMTKSWRYNTDEQMLFTDQLSEVQSQGPYDIVLLFDVLDHLRGNPIEALTQIKDMLSPGGRIYIRNHPWCSRHGAHLFTQINKAFIHLILDEIELTRLGGYTPEFCIKVTKPVATYRQWFDSAGLEVKAETILTENVEPYFSNTEANPVICERLGQHWKGEDASPFMSIVFIDYLLEAKESQQQIF